MLPSLQCITTCGHAHAKLHGRNPYLECLTLFVSRYTSIIARQCALGWLHRPRHNCIISILTQPVVRLLILLLTLHDQDKCGVRFAAVLGVCDKSFSKHHPAHPVRLPKAIQALLKSGEAYLQPGVAMNWEEYLAGEYSKATFLREQRQAIQCTTECIKKQEERKVYLKKQLVHCQRAGVVATCGSGLVGAAAFAFPPVALGLVATATMGVCAGIAAPVYNREMIDIKKNLRALNAQLKEQEEALRGFETMSDEDLQKHAQMVEDLVYGPML